MKKSSTNIVRNKSIEISPSVGLPLIGLIFGGLFLFVTQEPISPPIPSPSPSVVHAVSDTVPSDRTNGITQQSPISTDSALPQYDAALSQSGKSQGLPLIIAEWRPRVGYVQCDWAYSSGQHVDDAGSSLAIAFSDSGRIAFLTNKHVVVNGDGYTASICEIKLPDNTTIYHSITADIRASTSQDFAELTINASGDSNADPYLRNLTATAVNICKSKAAIGDSLVILGYPSYGSGFQDITATEGIVSGYDGDYYTTSAKIEHGNSGGVAIDERRDCYLGIPSAAVTGQIESLGRILSAASIFQK